MSFENQSIMRHLETITRTLQVLTLYLLIVKVSRIFIYYYVYIYKDIQGIKAGKLFKKAPIII
jgi:hypothetical protein